MGSTGKRRTTMAKLNREAKLREKRDEKLARKAARRSSGASDAASAASHSEGLGTASAGPDYGGPGGAGLDSVAAPANPVGHGA